MVVQNFRVDDLRRWLMCFLVVRGDRSSGFARKRIMRRDDTRFQHGLMRNDGLIRIEFWRGRLVSRDRENDVIVDRRDRGIMFRRMIRRREAGGLKHERFGNRFELRRDGHRHGFLDMRGRLSGIGMEVFKKPSQFIQVRDSFQRRRFKADFSGVSKKIRAKTSKCAMTFSNLKDDRVIRWKPAALHFAESMLKGRRQGIEQRMNPGEPLGEARERRDAFQSIRDGGVSRGGLRVQRRFLVLDRLDTDLNAALPPSEIKAQAS